MSSIKEIKKVLIIIILMIISLNVCYLLYNIDNFSLLNYIFSELFWISLLIIIVAINIAFKKTLTMIVSVTTVVLLIMILSLLPIGMYYEGWVDYEISGLIFNENSCMYAEHGDMGDTFRTGKCYKFFNLIVLKEQYKFSDFLGETQFCGSSEDILFFKRYGNHLVPLMKDVRITPESGDGLYLVEDVHKIYEELEQMEYLIQQVKNCDGY